MPITVVVVVVATAVTTVVAVTVVVIVAAVQAAVVTDINQRDYQSVKQILRRRDVRDLSGHLFMWCVAGV